MAFTPQSTVYLCDTPLDITQKNQLNFSNTENQYNYFASVVKHTYYDFTFIRKDNILRVPAHIDTLYDSNYVIYKNAAYGEKWFYCFIVNMEYVNDNCTAIYIKTDVYQTWLFDVELKPSFVVREHIPSNLDTPGYNLIEEGLETGEYVYKQMEFSGVLGTPVIILASTYDTTAQINESHVYSDTYAGVAYHVFDLSDAGVLNDYLQLLTAAGKIDAITCIFMYPGGLINYSSGGKLNDTDTLLKNFAIGKNLSSLDGYSPKNKKLLTYPYNVLHVSNQTGNSAELRYEFFQYDTCMFQIKGNLSAAPSVYCIPLNYKKLLCNYEESLTLSGFPLCNWSYSAFQNWLAQNGVSIALGTLSSLVSTGVGVATGNALGVAGGVLGIAGQLGQIYQHSIQPPHAKGNGGAGSAAFSLGILDFGFYTATITQQYAKMIDDYFEMFGYKVNEVKVPYTKSRPCWNYVQTIDVNLIGGIPVEDMAELKKIYNDGVTLWHSPSYVGNYSLINH